MQQQPPRIEFPCQYPIRVMGEAHDTFAEEVLAIVQRFAPEVGRDNLRLRDSSKGRFVSVHIVIRATGVEQLESLHTALLEYKAVKMVL